MGETVVPVRGTEIAKVTLIYSCIRYQGENLVSVGETVVPVRGTEIAKVTLIYSCIRYQGENLVSVGETCSYPCTSERDRNSEGNPHI